MASRTFNGQLLTLARQVRKFSQKDLVERLGGSLSQATLSKIEHGLVQPQGEIADAIAAALKLKRSFFFDDVYVRQPMMSYHRKRQKLSARDEDAVHAVAEVYRINLRKCLDAVEIEPTLPVLPCIDPDEYSGEIEQIAGVIRQRWGLPRGPVRNLSKLAEDAGVILIPFDFGSPLIDGFCQFGSEGLPSFVFLNTGQPIDRYRFSLAHELAHLVMHRTPNPDQEREANRFASEFLMPTREIKADFENLSLSRFMDMKLYWGVSMGALVYKAWQVGKLSDRMYKYYVIEMSKRGWKRQEPVEVRGFEETPSTLQSIVQAHVGELGFGIDGLAELFGLESDELGSLYSVQKSRPKLRLVASN